MLYVLRVSLPDQPGSLGEVCAALGGIGADIVSLRVIDRDSFNAVDEICVAGTGISPERIRTAVESAPGVVVEIVRRIARVLDPLGALQLADKLARIEAEPYESLCEGLPEALGATWALAMKVTGDGPVAIATSADSPPHGVMETPWLPITGPRKLPLGHWAPTNWRMHRFELAAAPLSDPFEFVIVGRWAGMRFRPTELRQIGLLSDLAVRARRVLAPA
ncbi:MAG: hypothetical protein WD646_12955 [Actinomycetota bacterium]